MNITDPKVVHRKLNQAISGQGGFLGPQGLCRSIRILYDQNCISTALQLIFVGIDNMSYIASGETRQGLTSCDRFSKWAEKYICPHINKYFTSSTVFVTGLDLYGARCGMIHNLNDKFRSHGQLQNAKEIQYSFKLENFKIGPIVEKSTGKKGFIVSVEILMLALEEGIKAFIEDISKMSWQEEMECQNRLLSISLPAPCEKIDDNSFEVLF